MSKLSDEVQEIVDSEWPEMWAIEIEREDDASYSVVMGRADTFDSACVSQNTDYFISASYDAEGRHAVTVYGVKEFENDAVEKLLSEFNPADHTELNDQ